VVTYSGHDCTPWQVVRAPIFWLMYAMFTMVSAGGLLAVAQIAPMAHDYQVDDVPVYFLGLTTTVLHLAMSLDRTLNGLARPFFGWLSDRFGRANIMFFAFTFGGLAIFLLINLAHRPLLFVLLTGLTFFTWGEVYSVFPALCADLFGRKFATTNYGLLYTAKGTAALLVPVGSHLKAATGSWVAVLALAVAFNWVAALLALFVLKPLCRHWSAGRSGS
jgi:OFA family oxalate/formate antiporter-like MFS transporter